MTKRDIIAGALWLDSDLPTKTVISKIRVEYGIDVSPRHVQRVRKFVIAEQAEENKVKGNDDMGINNDDTFDTGKGLEAWQLEMINMVNEPLKGDSFWSIQELAIVLEKTDKEVRQALADFNYMISNVVLDEEKNKNIIQLPFDGFKDDAPTGAPEKNRSASREDYWEVKIDCVTACSKVDQSVNVFLSKKVRQKAMLFMKWAKAREWLAYLVGNKTEDGYDITDLYLPDQRTSSTLVDKVKADEYNNLTIVGVIHSHHEMGAGDEDKPSFSGHDSEFINSNHNLSLLAGVDRKNGGFKVVGIARVQTPCGGMMKIKANVKRMKEKMSDEEKSLNDEFKDKVFGKTNNGLPGKAEEMKGNNMYHEQRQFVDHRHMRRGH